MKIINKKTFLLLLILFLPQFVLAQVTITGIVGNLAGLITNVAIFVVIVSWIITGLLFLVAQGDPTKLTKAKTALIWAVVGTAVAILAGSAQSIIQTAIESGV